MMLFARRTMRDETRPGSTHRPIHRFASRVARIEARRAAMDTEPVAVIPDARTHTLERIMERNPGARPGWLGQFDEPGLRMYLDRLEQLTGPAPRDQGRWVRPTGTPAATAYDCTL